VQVLIKTGWVKSGANLWFGHGSKLANNLPVFQTKLLNIFDIFNLSLPRGRRVAGNEVAIYHFERFCSALCQERD